MLHFSNTKMMVFLHFSNFGKGKRTYYEVSAPTTLTKKTKL